MKKLLWSFSVVCSLNLFAQKTKNNSKPLNNSSMNVEKEIITFCYENFTVALVNDGNGYAEMKRYTLDGRVASLTPGRWSTSKNNGYNDVYIKWRGSDETFNYLLIKDGNGFISKLIDGTSRSMNRCK
jgi:hypothetical protein